MHPGSCPREQKCRHVEEGRAKSAEMLQLMSSADKKMEPQHGSG